MAKQTTGCTFQLSATAISGAAGKLSEVTSVGFPNPKTGVIDTTHHESSGGVTENLPGLVDIGEIKVAMNVTPGSATDILCWTAATARALYYFKSNVPGSAGTFTYSGSGTVTSYDVDDAPVDGVFKGTITVKPSGPVTRA